MEAPASHPISGGLSIRVITTPYFLATKLEAFHGRGGNDYLGSRDMEDLVFVVAGRSVVAEEVLAAPAPVRSYLQEAINALLKTPAFLDALPGHLLPDELSQARISTVVHRLKAIAVK
ncbi:MAG: hypothetical protein SGI92_23635 [Bryobacteraceae bacterium]|nr:hypothetical protein [Bryobacteraceae bacterium]